MPLVSVYLLQSFLTALVTNAAIGAVTVGAFLVLRRLYANVYEPRHALNPTGPKQEALPRGLLSVIPAVLRARDEDIIRCVVKLCPPEP